MNRAAISILLVEDSAADAALLTKAFADSPFGPFSITYARRLAEALSHLHGQRFDAVLLDLGLPESQGLTTLKQIKRHNPTDVPVVVIGHRNEEALSIQALQAGADDYLIKGISTDTMRARSVRYAIELKRVTKALLASEQRLALAVEAARAGMIQWEAAAETATAREADLAHLSRVTTMGHLASGLVHEIGQPLNAIVNYASACIEQIESKKGSTAAARTAIHEVLNEALRAGTIIDSMRSFVRKQTPKTTRLDINQLVRESVHILEFEMRRRRICPDLQLAGNVPEVLGDTVQLEQVLVNLLLNALEAISETAAPQNGLTVKTALHDAGKSVEVCVVDTGLGIAPEDMGRLFEPFFTTKSNGLGMGLNICRSIIESRGGRLSAVRNPDRGMRFSFTIPVAA